MLDQVRLLRFDGQSLAQYLNCPVVIFLRHQDTAKPQRKLKIAPMRPKAVAEQLYRLIGFSLRQQCAGSFEKVFRILATFGIVLADHEEICLQFCRRVRSGIVIPKRTYRKHGDMSSPKSRAITHRLGI